MAVAVTRSNVNSVLDAIDHAVWEGEDAMRWRPDPPQPLSQASELFGVIVAAFDAIAEAIELPPILGVAIDPAIVSRGYVDEHHRLAPEVIARLDRLPARTGRLWSNVGRLR